MYWLPGDITIPITCRIIQIQIKDTGIRAIIPIRAWFSNVLNGFFWFLHDVPLSFTVFDLIRKLNSFT